MLPTPVTYTRPDDFTAIRQSIFDSAIKAVQERYPLENDNYILSIEDLSYDKIPEYSRLDQKRAVQTDKTLSAKLKGKWTLTDKKTGKVVSQSARKTILDVPYMTERGTFIRRGADQTLPIQMRLVPGVYTRIADNGEAKAHINIRPGTGTQMFLTMNPAKPVFMLSQGTRNYKLYPLLKNRGISDEQMMAAWGKDIYKANFDDFVSGGGWYGQKTAADGDPYDEISKRVFAGEVDPIATEFTLGKKFSTVTPDLMLNTSNKLLRVVKGEAEQDNRDSLENQRFFNAPDLIRERIRLDAGKTGQTLLWKASKSGNVENIPTGALNKYVNGLFTEAKLGQTIEETNPLDAYFRATKVTRMGEGGISSTDTAPMSARLVHNTYKGFVDPVISPECTTDRHVVMTDKGWVPIKDITVNHNVAVLEGPTLVYRHPDKVVNYDYDGYIYGYKSRDLMYEVTGNHRMLVAPDFAGPYSFKDAEWVHGKSLYMKTELNGLDTVCLGTTNYTVTKFTGKVYCLSIEGGVFYTKIPGYRAFWVGNSLRAGLDSGIAYSTVKGSDGLMYTPMISNVSGRKVMVNSIEASRVPVAFPEYYNSTEKYIPAMIGNKIEYLPRGEVKYFLPSGDSMFGLSSNMIPLKAGIKAGRLLMAQKHQTQAVSLANRMAPYVQTVDPNDDSSSVEHSIGKLMGAVFAEQPGKVVAVNNDEITVRYADGTKKTHSLYNNYHMNRKTIFHNIPEVKVGDMVKPGQVLASSNYTDKDGNAALGTQLRVAWLPYKGENYLDGIVVSEEAAKKFTSIHSYRAELDKDKGTTVGKAQYLAAFPTEFNKDQMETIDKDGTVKPGTVLKYGDPMILAYSKRASTPGSLHRELNRNAAIKWEHEFPATVIDVVNSPGGVKVYTKAELPLQSGDKIVARFANKGTTARVAPTSEMPIAADGRPVEVLLGPTGIVSRVNTAQLVEAMLGKVAEKTGKRYTLPGFSNTNLIDFAKKELKDAGLTDKEDLTDPTTGQTIPAVTVGNAYMVKLHHTSESKTGARGADGGYDVNELPAGGGHDSAKTLGGLILGAFQGHGAVEVTKDMKLIKGQQNSDFWRDFRLGRTPAMPKVPLVYERFLAHLEGSGINVHKDRNRTNIFALTQTDMDNLAKAEVKNADTYASGSLKPLPGGLFDPAIFGNEGNQWGYIKLDEPILNPIMEDPIRLLLGLTAADFDAVVAGNKKLPNGETGGKGLYDYLKSINVKDAINTARDQAKTATRTQRDNAVKKLRYLLAMDQHNTSPADFMLTKVPVIPPRFRRITMADDLTMVADANYLYKELLNNVNDVREAQAAGVPDEMIGNGKLAIYNAFKAVTGLTDPDARKLQEKQITGLLKWVFGKGSPKMGGYQRLVVGGKLDLAGRNVINVNPSLKMDEAGLPEKNAWSLYGNFIIRKLTQRGMTPLQAAQEVDKKSETAYKAMQEVVKERPLIITRAPALHKYSVMAFKPKLIKGDVLQLGPAVQGPFNADHDGDTMTYYVPVSDKAVKEAYNKMLPSKNLLAARDYKAHYLPQEEYILGGWLAYRDGKGPVKQVFKTKEDAILAYKQGKIGLNDNIQILS